MQFDILTIFPEIFSSYFNASILKIAQKKNKIKINIHNIRDYTKDKHKKTDDSPYGGGPGMVMTVQPIYDCLKAIKKKKKSKIIILDPAGKMFNQKIAKTYSEKLDQIILICGRYEGFDERVYSLVDEKLSIGQYVLSGGELPAMVVVEAVSRLIPGVLGHQHSADDETFSPDLDYIEYPQYTKPAKFMGKKVPKVLLSGNHAKIKEWRQKHAK
ncbi:MAG: tRNA (guanosine(37)-N1)-methyltransferase TrmD [Patescibacteria group bacterium]|jgi:tRNA (guanine37-N1)-methyltransferase